MPPAAPADSFLLAMSYLLGFGIYALGLAALAYFFSRGWAAWRRESAAGREHLRIADEWEAGRAGADGRGASGSHT